MKSEATPEEILQAKVAEDESYMRLALEEAIQAGREGEVPIGAVAVHNGIVIARNHNRKEQLKNPCAHAEILLLQDACQFFRSWRVEETTVYVTLEPCPMCAGALWQARIDRLVFGTRDLKAGAVCTLYELLSDTRLNHQAEITEGVLQKNCRELLQQFFQERRKEGKK